jgi:hypothetical protein
MPVELHERLSEFSYGYGVTREAEEALESVGLTAVPFLPSLLHEAELGFDVGFDRPGAPLLLQFKLGQAMRRFVPGPRPALSPGFWRFQLDTAEPDGQYELLLKAQQDGAEVYYVAPMFHDWEAYLQAFGEKEVLEQSLLVTPAAIRAALDTHSIPDGPHKVVYDEYRAYLCSEPHRLEVTRARDLGKRLRGRIEQSKMTLGGSLRRVFAGFSERGQVRQQDVRLSPDRAAFAIPSDTDEAAELRQARFEDYRERFPTEDDAIAAAVAAEAWGSGVQLVMATLD